MKQAFETVLITALFMTVLSILLHHVSSTVSTAISLSSMEYECMECWKDALTIIQENGRDHKKWDEWYNTITNDESVLTEYRYVIYVERLSMTPYPQTIWNITLGQGSPVNNCLVFYTIIVLDDGSLVKVACLS